MNLYFDDDEAPKLTKPEFPRPPGNPEALNDSQRWAISYRIKHYEEDMPEFGHKAQWTGEVRSKIFYSVAENNVEKFVNTADPKTMLRHVNSRPNSNKVER